MDVFPFFVGSDRSGTTLVQAVFNAHSELAIPYESHFIAPLLLRRAKYERSTRFNVEGFAYDLLQFPFVGRWDLTRDDILAALADAAPRSSPDAIRAVFDLYAREEAKSRYGDKTPGYVRRIPLIADAFPEARFIHVIRDGRDVALSLLDVEWAPDRIVDAARFWKRRVDAGRRARAVIGDERLYELHYEGFVADPEGSTRSVCAFLGLSFEPEMLDYTGAARTIVDQSGVPHRHQGVLQPPTTGKRDWRREMTPDQLALFEAVAGDSLVAFGYERALPKVPTTTRARARAELALRKAKGLPDRMRTTKRMRAKRLPKML